MPRIREVPKTSSKLMPPLGSIRPEWMTNKATKKSGRTDHKDARQEYKRPCERVRWERLAEGGLVIKASPRGRHTQEGSEAGDEGEQDEEQIDITWLV